MQYGRRGNQHGFRAQSELTSRGAPEEARVTQTSRVLTRNSIPLHRYAVLPLPLKSPDGRDPSPYFTEAWLLEIPPGILHRDVSGGVCGKNTLLPWSRRLRHENEGNEVAGKRDVLKQTHHCLGTGQHQDTEINAQDMIMSLFQPSPPATSHDPALSLLRFPRDMSPLDTHHVSPGPSSAHPFAYLQVLSKAALGRVIFLPHVFCGTVRI